MTRTFRVTTAVLMVALPALATAQVNFSKDSYYVAMGDSVAAGEGALPVTSGYPYQLYDQSRFDHRQQMDFANVAVRGARSWEMRDHQVAQVLCAEPAQRLPCRSLANVTILVSNYYSIPHPNPIVFAQLDSALRGFDLALQYWLQFTQVPQGSRVAPVDLYSASLGQQGLVTIERRLGLQGPFDFDIHPTNLGHSFIAREFHAAWKDLP